MTVRLHNIWEDADARQFVREHNAGNETVPTVRLGDRAAVNPAPDGLISVLVAEYPDLVGSAPTALRRRRDHPAGPNRAGSSGAAHDGGASPAIAPETISVVTGR